ncbi:5930_t:CDS:2, partial [Ambispora leptoticha]
RKHAENNDGGDGRGVEKYLSEGLVMKKFIPEIPKIEVVKDLDQEKKLVKEQPFEEEISSSFSTSKQPVAKLLYIAETEKAVEYPNKIPEDGLGNKDFNQGLKVSKFAYKINHLYKLVNPVDSKQLKTVMKIFHDNEVHHPLGGGSYVFKKKYVDYILSLSPKSDIKVSIGAQPNGSPHFGTITTFSLAFSLAQQLKNNGKNIMVVLELVDTAISENYSFDNIRYQKSLAYTKEIDKHVGHYQELLEKLSSYSGIDFEIRGQSEFNSHRKIPEVVSKIIQEKEKVGSLLSPESKVIALRVACPQCGLADKHGKKNIYAGNDAVISFCPEHGVIYSEDNQDVAVPYSWIRVTGGDYAGTYQEQILYKGAAILGTDITILPFIIYSPLKGAYGYLKEQALDYLIDYHSFKKTFTDRGLKKLYEETKESKMEASVVHQVP